MSQLSDGPKPCDYCGQHTQLLKRDGTICVWCPSCFANGPHIIETAPGAERIAIERYNSNKLFGKISAANVPFGMPSETMGLSERLQLIGKAIAEGTYGFPTSAALVMRQNQSANVLTHNISDMDTGALLSAVLDSWRVRRKI